MMYAAEEMLIDPEEMREAASRLLSDKVDRRAGYEGKAGGAAALDAEIADLGWYQLTVAEEQGGLGQSFEAIAPIYEEMGRSLAPLWLAGTMSVLDAISAASGDDAKHAVATAVEESWRIAPIVLAPGQTLHDATLPVVPGAPDASHLLVVEPQGKASLVAADAPGVSVVEVETWDLGRSYGEVVLSGASDIVAQFDASQVLPVLRAHGELALAWDSIGGAAQSLAETVDYMLGRRQFDRPIASFQALKHRAADHKVAIEMARSLTGQASRVFATRGDGWQILAAQARILACDAYAAMAEDSVQLHGGVGFTWEYNPHLFLKRALVNRIIGGSADELRDRIAADVCRRVLASRD